MNGMLLQFVGTVLAGWVHRGQQQIVDYLIEENRGTNIAKLVVQVDGIEVRATQCADKGRVTVPRSHLAGNAFSRVRRGRRP
jgi:hypothetical protein